MTDVIREWCQNGQFISIEGIELLPLSSEEWTGIPIVYKSESAEVYYLRDSVDQLWVIKKFLKNTVPQMRYREAIKPLIPHRPGFEAGYLRKVLNQTSVSSAGPDRFRVSAWVENAILMPAVSGYRLDRLLKSVSEGKQIFHRKQRIKMVCKLSEKIQWLEGQDISHRDLSGTSVYINEKAGDVHLVDWDNIFHATLAMPEDLKRGTNGYIAPFSVAKEDSYAQNTWKVRADRFSLALLNSEILSVHTGFPVTGVGGCCHQDEIYNLRGICLTAITDALKAQYSKATRLLEQSLAATSFDDCPAPAEWLAAMSGEPAISAKPIPIRGRGAFVSLNKVSFAKIDKSAFVKLNRNAFVKAPYGKEPNEN